MISEDTICAISTPVGSGAIAIVRLSGKDSLDIIQKLFKPRGKGNIEPNRLVFGDILDNNKIIDEVMVSYYKAPNSYTGEDIIEVSCHGSVYIQQEILTVFMNHGARLAKPGEFTQRAFLNNKLDLSQAEGVADIIATSSAAAHKIAIQQIKGGFSSEINDLRSQLLKFVSLIELELDFGEEDVEFANRDELKTLLTVINEKFRYLIDSFKLGNVIKNGIPVAIAGPPNAGKSTLLNALLNDDKAIVTDIPGTTRDVIEDTININGYLFRFIDTAGIRDTNDKIETLGIGKTFKKLAEASIILAVIESTDDIVQLQLEIQNNADKNAEVIYLFNKMDLLKKSEIDFIAKQLGKKHIIISASNKTNLDQLIERLTYHAGRFSNLNNDIVVSNIRHYEALSKAYEALERANMGLQTELSSDLLAMDIREAIHYLGEITGEITTDEILGEIFKSFCIGK